MWYLSWGSFNAVAMVNSHTADVTKYESILANFCVATWAGWRDKNDVEAKRVMDARRVSHNGSNQKLARLVHACKYGSQRFHVYL